MSSLEDFFGNLTIEPNYVVTLDLDSVENIAHPFWEILDPIPDIYQSFDRFNKLFFDGIFTNEHRNNVTLKWFEKRGQTAAQTWAGTRKKPIRIEMNVSLLKRVLRKELIETLIHEMIHAYLIVQKLESEENDYHCKNFERIRKEINAKANLDITVRHDYDLNDRYMWRCRKECRLIGPFFGFAFLKKENKEPNYKTHMVLPQGKGCAHSFERCIPGSDAKRALSKWACIEHFVTQIKGMVRIKTSHEISQDPRVAKEFMFERSAHDDNSFLSHNTSDDASNHEEIDQTACSNPSESGNLIDDYIAQRSPSQGYNSSRSTDTNCIESVNGDGDPSCSTENNDCIESANFDDSSHQVIEKIFLEDKLFANFDKNKKTLLLNIYNSHLHIKFADNLEKCNYLYVCMICEESVDDDKATIVEHLKNCTAASYALPPEENDKELLPIYKLTKATIVEHLKNCTALPFELPPEENNNQLLLMYKLTKSTIVEHWNNCPALKSVLPLEEND